MGGSIAVMLDEASVKKHPGKQYIHDKRLEIFPETGRVGPGSLIAQVHVLPPGVRFLTTLPDNLYWWPDIQFMPHSECSLMVSMGAYLDRPGRCPLIPYNSTHGLIYKLFFCGHGDTIQHSLLRGTHTPGQPNIAVHPSGNTFTYASSTHITLMNHRTRWSTKRNNDIRMNTFKYTAVTPSGSYVAAMSRSSGTIELETFLIDTSYFIKQFCIDCNHICPGFKTVTRNPARFECKFSPDSDFIACASSDGQLFVVKRYELKKHCVVIPGVISDPIIKISNERCFDFDPRFLHRFLAFTDNDGRIFVCDVDNQVLVQSRDLRDRTGGSLSEPELTVSAQCLRYSPDGRHLTVALSNNSLALLDPDSLSTIHTIDMTPHVTPGTQSTTVRITLSSTGNVLATASSDGQVRLWQLWPDLSLQQLCRRVILRHVRMCDITRLPLPSKLLFVLLQWPELE